MRPGGASESWTIQFIFATSETSDLYLPAFELSLANIANTQIIDRIPSAKPISRTQDQKSIVEFDVSDHG
jgi:hypothetical protein